MADDAAVRAWIETVLGFKVPAAAASAATPEGAWSAARSAALRDLKTLEKAIAGMDHPRATAALILLKSIQMNLPAKLASPETVRDVRRYLETDDIIADAERPNGFGIKIDLRKPLLAALGNP